MEGLLIITLLAGFVVSLGFIFLLSTHFSRSSRQFAWEPLPTDPLPYRRRSFLFSAAERSFYKTLRAIVPDHMIFVKVRLGDLVSSPDHSFWEHFSPINRKHIDFLVCDPTMAPVLAIELDGAPARPFQNDLVQSVLASASLPMLRIPEKRYPFADLRSLLAPYLHVPAPLL